jgi:hypothetical protein
VLLHDDGRVPEDTIDVALDVRPRVRLVGPELLVDQGRLVGQRLVHVHDRGERVVVDLHRLDRVLGDRARTRDDHRHAVALVPRLVGHERVVQGVVQPLRDGPGHQERAGPVEVRTREGSDDAVHRRRLGHIDALDPRVRVGAPHDRHPEHPGDGEIVRVPRRAGEELGILLPQDRLTDELLRGRHPRSPPQAFAPDIWPAASRIDSTMFW